MTTAGWVFLTLSWGGILALAVFCYLRILKSNQRKEP